MGTNGDTPGDVPVAGDRRKGAADQAYSEILRRLELRTFLPGDRLPAATALAAEIGVSRMAVLTALRTLEGEDRVTVRPGRAGTRVNPLSTSRDARWAKAWQKRQSLLQINALMEVIEPGVARYLARHGIPREAVAAAREVNEELRQATDAERLLGLENRFHIVLAAATGQKMLEVLVIAGRVQVSGIWDLLDTATPTASALAAEHDQLLTAIVAGDGRAAGDLAGRHVDDILDAVNDTFGPDAPPGPFGARSRPTPAGTPADEASSS